MARVRLAEIAERAGVTRAAASMALNGKPGVSPETRDRIRTIARDLGYVAHQGAKALVGGVTGLWGAFIDVDPEIWPVWLGGALAHGSASGARVCVQKMPSRERRAEFFRQLASEARFDGVLLLDPTGDDGSLRTLWESKLPVVVAGRRSWWFDCVEIHDRLAQEQALSLLSLDGKRSVALVATRSQVNQDDSRIGFWRKQAEPESDRQELIVVPEDSPEAGVQAMSQLRKLAPDIRAVFCLAGDRTAWGMIREARLRQISVPGDLAISGWGDMSFATWTDPELTTVRIPWEELGIRSAWLLQNRLAHPDGARIHRTLDARLVTRRSG